MMGGDRARILGAVEGLGDRLVSLCQDLVRIPSPSGSEVEVQSLLASRLKEWGFSVTSLAKDPRRPNIVGEVGSGNPRLLFVGHSDNIPAADEKQWRHPPFSAVLDRGRIYGRGVADMKAGLAAMVIAALAVKTVRGTPGGSIAVVSTVDEEVESEYGMKYLAEGRLIQGDGAIFGEPTFPYVVVKLKGGVWLRLTTLGRSVGSGWKDEGVNAVLKMARVLLELEKLKLGGGSDPLLGRATIAPGTTINSIGTMHSIPSSCSSTVEIYTIPGMTTDVVVRAVKERLERLQAADDDLEVDLKVIFKTEPYETDTGSKVYRTLRSSVASIMGSEPKPRGVPSVGDARFTRELGIPAVAAYGPGEFGRGHVKDESVSIDTLLNVAGVYALTAFDFLSS